MRYLVLIVVSVLLIGCSSEEPTTLTDALTLYRQHKLSQALPLLQQAAADNPHDPDARCWWAETLRRMGEKNRAVVAARSALHLDSCHSFALTVIADATLPPPNAPRHETDTAWVYVNRALACDSTDCNAWLTLWGEAIQRERFDRMAEAERRLHEAGFITPAMRAYARWMLQTLPENAVLITNGDMDTYPPRALQQAESFRTDVLIVERGLLNLAAYLKHLRQEHGLSLPFSDSEIDSICADGGAYQAEPSLSDQVFRFWLEQMAAGAIGRPLAIAPTVDPAYYQSAAQNISRAGAYRYWQADANNMADTVLYRRCFEELAPGDFEGPWVSERDRSSVRNAFTHRIAGNVSEAALDYSQVLMEAGRFDAVRRMIDWVEQFEEVTELGSVFGERIAAQRSALP